jgi:hypothetical protein
VQAQTRGGEAPAPGVRLVPRAAAGAGGGCRGSPGKRGRALEAGYVAPNAVYERALSATDVSYEGRRLADTELLTPPPRHTTTAWDTCTGRTAPPPHRRLLWSLTPDTHHMACANAIDIGRWAAYHGALS